MVVMIVWYIITGKKLKISFNGFRGWVVSLAITKDDQIITGLGNGDISYDISLLINQ